MQIHVHTHGTTLSLTPLLRIHGKEQEPSVKECRDRLLSLQNTQAFTCDGPEVNVTFILASGEGQDVLGAIATDEYRAQFLDALVGQDTNPAA